MLGPTKPPLSKVTHVPHSGVWQASYPAVRSSDTEHPYNSSSGAGEPAAGLGTALPPETFQPRHTAAQGCEQLPRAVSRTPRFTPDSQYAEEGSGSGNQMALDPTRMKKPQTGSHIRNV